MEKATMQQILTVDPKTDNVPDCGLGNFINGYTDTHITYKIRTITIVLGCLAALLAILSMATPYQVLGLLAAASAIIFVIMILTDLYRMTLKKRISVYMYQDGFLWRVHSNNGAVKKEQKFNYSDMDGVNLSSTKQYINGFYNSTNCSLTVMSKGKVVFFKSGTHRSELNNPAGFDNSTILGMYAISNQWSTWSIERIINQFQREGSASFLTSTYGDTVTVTPSTITLKDKQIDMKSEFTYQFDNGSLIIKQKTGERKLFNNKSIAIDVNNMFNRTAFLYLVSVLFGIK